MKNLQQETLVARCAWVGNDPTYTTYHDLEWGVPVGLPTSTSTAEQQRLADRTQFEFLILEGAQAGLSWLTILKRREGYRKRFCEFDPAKVAEMSERDIQAALHDPGIIRNQLKVRAAVKNAQIFLAIAQEFGSFSAYIWRFVDNTPIISTWHDRAKIPATSTISDMLSKDLKARGMNFVGSTIMYAHMQATGLINDHEPQCTRAVMRES